MMLTEVLIITTIWTLAYLIYVKLNNIYTYWEKRGIKGPKPELPFGFLRPLATNKLHIQPLLDKIYREYPEEKAVGLFLGLTPILYIRDPDLLKKILIKDFNKFPNRGVAITKETVEKYNLFSLDYEPWTVLRQKLSSLYTANRLRQMLPLFNSCIKNLIQYLDTVDQKQPIEFRRLFKRYATQSVTSIGFGLNLDPTTKENITFARHHEIMAARLGVFRTYALVANNIFPGILDLLGITIFPKSTTNYFQSLKELIFRERNGKPSTRRDFMDLIIEMKDQAKLTKTTDNGVYELDITDEIVMAQAALFLTGGLDSISSILSLLVYELALNPDIQERSFNEVKLVMEKHNDELTYDSLREMQYLTMVFEELLRKYPIMSVVLRECTKSHYISELNLHVDKGTRFIATNASFSNDPKYFPEPEKFNPERFRPENNVNGSKVYMPFGAGPRQCIASRFARIQFIVGAAHFIHNYCVMPCDKTVGELVWDPRFVVPQTREGIWLLFERRTKQE